LKEAWKEALQSTIFGCAIILLFRAQEHRLLDVTGSQLNRFWHGWPVQSSSSMPTVGRDAVTTTAAML
jgi:hypothetical protein